MTIEYTLKMKNIKNFDIYNDNKLDISKIGNFYGRDASKVDILNDNEIHFPAQSIYYDDIFKELTLMNLGDILLVKQEEDENFDYTPFAFYKDGKFILTLVIVSKSEIIYSKVDRYDILDVKSKEDAKKLDTHEFNLDTKNISKEEFLAYFDDKNKWILEGII